MLTVCTFSILCNCVEDSASTKISLKRDFKNKQKKNGKETFKINTQQGDH